MILGGMGQLIPFLRREQKCVVVKYFRTLK
jgi:hypothetical protein